jgi:hypothetical protein
MVEAPAFLSDSEISLSDFFESEVLLQLKIVRESNKTANNRVISFLF